MGSKTMKRNSFVAWCAAAVVALAGCSLKPPVTPATLPSGEAQTASVAVGLDWGRQVQALPEDVTGATVSIRVNGRDPIIRSFLKRDWATESVDFSGLPGGDAVVRVEAYNGPTLIGMGERGLPLVIGRRTFVRIQVPLDSHGRTNTWPMTPLGPMPDPKARLFISKVVFHTNSVGPLWKRHELYIKNLTGRFINDLDSYDLVFYPTAANQTPIATPLLGADNMPVRFLDASASLKVYLDQEHDLTTDWTAARTTFPVGTVQYGAGGSFTLRKKVNSTFVVRDFLQWVITGSSFESNAVAAGFWDAGTTLSTVPVSGYEGAEMVVNTEGARGAGNWTVQPFGPISQ